MTHHAQTRSNQPRNRKAARPPEKADALSLHVCTHPARPQQLRKLPGTGTTISTVLCKRNPCEARINAPQPGCKRERCEEGSSAKNNIEYRHASSRATAFRSLLHRHHLRCPLPRPSLTFQAAHDLPVEERPPRNLMAS
jgi:hypothetical protein